VQVLQVLLLLLQGMGMVCTLQGACGLPNLLCMVAAWVSTAPTLLLLLVRRVPVVDVP
jgi:hypothetical protein